jgi:Sap, sulfolipid-1-addressing protein
VARPAGAGRATGTADLDAGYGHVHLGACYRRWSPVVRSDPKNLVLTLAAGKAIAATGVSTGQQFVALVVFALIGTIGPGLPVAVYFLMGDWAPKLLAEMKSWLGANNTVIMVVLCVVIAAKLVGDGIAGLTG